MRAAILLLFLAALASFNAPSSFACEAAGANTHIGVVTVVDLPRRTFTLKDAETAKPIVFVATTEQLKGVKVDDGDCGHVRNRSQSAPRDIDQTELRGDGD